MVGARPVNPREEAAASFYNSWATVTCDLCRLPNGTLAGDLMNSSRTWPVRPSTPSNEPLVTFSHFLLAVVSQVLLWVEKWKWDTNMCFITNVIIGCLFWGRELNIQCCSALLRSHQPLAARLFFCSDERRPFIFIFHVLTGLWEVFD